MEKEFKEGNITLSKSVLVDPEQTNAIQMVTGEDHSGRAFLLPRGAGQKACLRA